MSNGKGVRSGVKAHKELAELETQLLLSRELGFLSNEGIDRSIEQIRKMLLGLIKHLKGKS